MECEERTRKKAEKRKRKKQAAKKGAKNASKQAKPTEVGKESSSGATRGSSSGSGAGSGSGSDGDAVEEFVYISVADRAASGGDGGALAAFKNDGSFLELMRKELEGAGPGKAARVASGGKPVAAK